MKSLFIAAAAASVLVASSVTAAPFPQPKASSVVATQGTYSSMQYTVTAHGRFSFPVPVINRPIHLMIAALIPGDFGAGSVTLVHVTGGGFNFLEWVGSDIASNGSFVHPAVPVDSGNGVAKGTHIMYADDSANVDVVVNSTQSLAIVNNNNEPITVVVTMTY